MYFSQRQIQYSNVKPESSFNIQAAFGIYITFPDHPEKVFGETCRHVIIPFTERNNLDPCIDTL